MPCSSKYRPETCLIFFHFLQILTGFQRYCINAGIGRQRLAVFGNGRLPGGIRSSGPTPTGSCWRTRQSPPNPLARFRAVATVRCVKTPGLQRPFRSRRLCRAVACAPGIPAKRRRDVRRNAVSRTRSPSLRRVPAHCLPGATHPYESLSPGA